MPDKLLPSPRHWNAGMFEHAGSLWLAYRHHRMDLPDARCAIALTKIDPLTLQPIGKSQLLNLSGHTGTEHFEDPRLFEFKGEPHISYTEMSGYRPGVDYNCVVKYAKLSLERGKWKVVQAYHPRYGKNNGFSKEKNWVFFEADGRLFCFYQGTPKHIVLEINEGRIVTEYITAGPSWPWGDIRGGAQPVRMGNHFVHVFHSSLPTETPPHFVRYYAGVYTFDAKPPFAVKAISVRPLAAGSEEDGHQVDPRYVAGWKPFVVFPGGLAPTGVEGKYYLSMGVNDWQTVIAPIDFAQVELLATDSALPVRYFRAINGSRPEPYLVVERGMVRQDYLHWDVPKPGRAGSAGPGFLKTSDQRVAEELSQQPHVTEISEQDYVRAMGLAYA